jgi:hypothetical protein
MYWSRGKTLGLTFSVELAMAFIISLIECIARRSLKLALLDENP